MGSKLLLGSWLAWVLVGAGGRGADACRAVEQLQDIWSRPCPLGDAWAPAG